MTLRRLKMNWTQLTLFDIMEVQPLTEETK
jgi:hypothetical protein